MNSYIITDGGIMVSIGMKPYNIEVSHPRYEDILDAVRNECWDEVPDLASIANTIVNYGDGKVSVDVEHGVVTYNGDEIDDTLTERMLQMMNEGFDISPLVNFLDNVMQNPSAKSVEELYGFLDFGKMPITPDGHFLAYKRVREDFMSCYDGKTDNSIGNVVTMDRNKVDDRSSNTCSRGLHFCSHEYLSNFWGDKVVVLKIHPRDVVSIPTDYNNTKGRACRYEVVGELDKDEVHNALAGSSWGMAVNVDYEDRDFDDDDDNLDEYVDAGDIMFYNPDVDLGLQDAVSEDYVNGYANGYTNGRNKTPGSNPRDFDVYLHAHEAWGDGYIDGHNDGRGHKRKIDWTVIEV